MGIGAYRSAVPGGVALAANGGMYFNALGQLVYGAAPNPGNQLPSMQTPNAGVTTALGWALNLNMSYVTGNPLAGTYSFENATTGSGARAISPVIQCVPGQVYYAQMFVRCGTTASGDTATIRINYQNAAGSPLGFVAAVTVTAFSTTSTLAGQQFTVPALEGGQIPSQFTVQVQLDNSGDGNTLFCDAVALVNATTSLTLAPAAVQAGNMAANAIAVSTTAVQAGALIDQMISSVGLNKLAATTVTQGTAIFTGPVVLSQGSAAPCLVLLNTSLTLFSSASVSSGVVTGLTSSPFVQVEPTGVLVAQSSTGPSVLIGVPSGGSSSVTVYSVNGSLSSPWIQMSATTLTFDDGGGASHQYMVIQAGSLTIARAGGSQLSISASGLVVSNGTNSVKVDSSGVTIVGGTLTNSANNALTTLNNVLSGSLSLTVGTTVQITSGTFNGYYTSMSGLGFHCQDSGNNLTAAIQTSNLGDYGVLNLNQVASPFGKIQMDSSVPAIKIGQGIAAQVLTSRQTGPGAPTGFTDATAQAWALSLYNSLSHAGGGHGLIN